MKRTILIKRLTVVTRYFFLFLLIFFRAISPSIPNILVMRELVLIFFLFILISSFCLIASIGDILLALREGISADTSMIINIGIVTRWRLYSKAPSRRLFSTIMTVPIPRQAPATPKIIPIVPTIIASKKIIYDSCLLVAPVLDNKPNSFFLSITDIAKEL